MKNKYRIQMSGLMIAVLVISILMPLYVSAEEKQTVRVGYFDIGDYYMLDANGNMQGYDADYLQEVSNRTNLQFEFVDCDTWMNAVEMLNEGEVDLVGATQWNEKREETYEFCLEDYGQTIGEIVVPSKVDIVYKDYDAISQLKIGCLENYIHREELDAKLQSENIRPVIATYQTQGELEEALANEEIDAIASNSHLVDQSLKVIEKFSYSPMYFIARKGNSELIDQIDEALIKLRIDKPQFDDSLTKKYFPTLNNNQLTKAEQEYVDSLGTLSFCFCTNEGYLCRTEKNAYAGINPAVARKVCELLGVTYQEVQFDFPELMQSLSKISDGTKSSEELVKQVKSMKVDVWGDFYYDQNWADTLNVGLTEPYLDATYYEIQKRGSSVNHAICKVAAVRGLRYTADVVTQYQEDQIVWCDDFEGCIKAVKAGKADVTVINTYAAEYYLSMFQYNNLSANLIDLTNQSAMATVNDPEGLLASALSKTIRSISSEEMNALIREETANDPEQNMFIAYFYNHTMSAVMLLAALAAGIVLLITMMYSASKNKRQNELLRHATSAKSDFLARMSHDIRTPMNAIINLTDMVEQEIDDKQAALNDIQKIKTSNEFLLSIINDVLDISRIEEGKMVLNHQVYNASEFLSYIHTTFDALCEEKHITFLVEHAENDIAVLTDRVRFNQVCFNLVSNAVKYTSEGGQVRLALRYGTVKEGKQPLDIYVIDNGIGMSPEFVARAYQAFEQENRQYMAVEGTGLGLSIVKQIVDLMGGTIEIDSKENHGTIVHVHLCLQLAAQKDVDAEAENQVTKQVSREILRGKKVLVVDDHEMNLQIATRLLEKKGMEVITATNGMEAVRLFQESSEEIHAILMDVRMPVMNGLDATVTIRKLDLPYAKTVPIIAMTANAYVEDMEKSRDAGMNAHLSKPINPAELFGTLSELMEIFDERS